MNYKSAPKQLCIIIILCAILIQSCSSSEVKKVNEGPTIIRAEEPAPPGTADIRADVLSMSKMNNEIVCSIKVTEVLKYGASMRPLPPGSEIKIHIPEAVFSGEEINEGNEILLRVSYLLPAQNEIGYWNFIRFNK